MFDKIRNKIQKRRIKKMAELVYRVNLHMYRGEEIEAEKYRRKLLKMDLSCTERWFWVFNEVHRLVEERGF